jgi:hypothetical protein
MALNPNIALAVKGPEFADPLAMYGRIAAIQGAQAQNQLAQYQLGAAQRTETRDLARMNALAAAGTDETAIANALLKSGDIKGYSDLLKASAERKTALLGQQKTEGEILKGKLEQSRELLGTINSTDPDAPNQYLAWHEANHRDPVLGPMLAARGVTADQARARINQAIEQGPQAFADLLNQSKLGVEKFMTLNAPKTTSQDLGGTARLIQTPGLGGPATVVAGSTAEKTLTPGEAQRGQEVDYVNNGKSLIPTYKIGGKAVEGLKPIPLTLNPYQAEQIRLENERLIEERKRVKLEDRRVAVTERQQELAEDPAFQARMTEAKTAGRKFAESDVAAVQNMPKLLNQADDALKLIDAMVGKAPVKDSSGKVIQAGTAPHPGFKSAVGMGTWGTLGIPGVAAMIPGTDAAGFMRYFKQTEGAAFLEVFEALKGGGAITEKEGEKATQARIRLSTTTDEKEFMTAAREYQDILRRGIENIKKRGEQANARLRDVNSSPVAPSSSVTPSSLPAAPPLPAGYTRD